MESSWTNWESGDALVAPSDAMPLQAPEFLSKIASSFSRIVIDWHEGSRWVEARIAKATSLGYPPELLKAERGLRGRAALISLTDAAGEGAPSVSFFLVPDTNLIELHYEPPGFESECQSLAKKLGDTLGYGFDSLQG